MELNLLCLAVTFDDVRRVITVILLSSVKFFVGPFVVYTHENYDFTFFETNLYTVIGGMLGVTIMIYFSDWIVAMYRKVKKFVKRTIRKLSGEKKSYYSPPVVDIDSNTNVIYEYVEKNKKQKRVFTTRNRRIVRLWKAYGLIGISALTPILFSIPIGTFIITRLEHNRKKVLFYLFISIVSWSLVLTTFFELTHVKSIHEILE